MTYPSLFLALSGLITGISLTFNNYPWFISYILFSIPFLFVLKDKKFLYFSLGIFLGVITTYLHIQPCGNHIIYHPYNTITKAEGTIISSRPSTFSTEYVVKIGQITTEDGKTDKVSGKILLKVRERKHSGYPSGTYLIMENLSLKRIQPPENPSSFDYVRYMERKGIFLEGEAERIETGSHWYPVSIFQDARNILVKRIEMAFLFFPEEKELLTTITMGKEKIPYFLQKAGVRSGTYHLLVISGLHIGFLLLFLRVLFIPIAEVNNRHPKLFPSFVLVAIWFYAGLTGFKVPVVRAVLMASFFFLGEIFERDMDILSSIVAAAFLLLIINPYNLFDASFQLSFLATLGIVLFWKRFKLPERNYIRSLLFTSLAAQIAVFPLLLYHFGYFYPVGLVNNIFFIPLTGGILMLSIISFIVPLLFPLLRALLTVFLRGITLSARFSPSIHFSPSFLLILAFYSLLLLVFYPHKRKSIRAIFLSIILILIPLHFLSYEKEGKSEELYLLSFTKPSAVYIKEKEGIAFLADHYNTREIEDILVPFLSQKKVKTLTLFYTTLSYNHTATLNTLKRRFNIKNVYEAGMTKEHFAYNYLDIYYYKTSPSLFVPLAYEEEKTFSGIKVEAIGDEEGTVSYIIKKDGVSILLAPFIGQSLAEKISGKRFNIAYIGDIKKTKKVIEPLSSIRYRYLILPQKYKKFEQLPETEQTLYLKQSAVKVLLDNSGVDVRYHYQ